MGCPMPPNPMSTNQPIFDLSERFESSIGEIAHATVGRGPDVVLVHGIPTSSMIWRPVVNRLQDRYTFHLLDLPGYGQSSKFDGQDVRLRALTQALTEWLGHLQLDHPVLVGHDFGAATVLGAHLVEEYPVRALAISDGVVLSPWGSEFSRHVHEYPDIFAAVPEYIHSALLRAHIATAMWQNPSRELVDSLVAPFLGEEGQAAYYRHIAQFDYEYTDILGPLYPDLEIPLLVLWGERDEWVDIDQGRRLVDLAPDAELKTLPDAGHFAMLDTPGLFSSYLDGWLIDLPTG